MTARTAGTVCVRRPVSAPPDVVFALVADVTRMGQWSPETTTAAWRGGATAAAVGARFTGRNRNGWHRWSTANTVVACEEGRRFAFETTTGPFAVAGWAYDIEPSPGGCTVTETCTDRRNRLVAWLGGLVSGVGERSEHNRRTMETTLARLAAAAEAAAGG